MQMVELGTVALDVMIVNIGTVDLLTLHFIQ